MHVPEDMFPTLPTFRPSSLVAALFALVLFVSACGESANSTNTAPATTDRGSETPTTSAPEDVDDGILLVEDISFPINERDLSAARYVLDEGRFRWESYDPFPYVMTIGYEGVSEIAIEFDETGAAVREDILRGSADNWETTSVPRSVDAVFDELDRIIGDFENGTKPVPPPGECGNHFNARFDTDLGVPVRYDTLGPCEDGIGIVINISRTATGEAEPDPIVDDDPILQIEDGAIEAMWEAFGNESQPMERSALPPIDGFEPFNDAWILPDGRFLAAGRWVGDSPIPQWHQPNPDSLDPDADVPDPTELNLSPVRLFVIDSSLDAEVAITPLSHVPEVRPFTTATSIGESADVILDAVLLDDGATIAYIAGFSGAGYDQPRVLYTVLLPGA